MIFPASFFFLTVIILDSFFELDSPTRTIISQIAFYSCTVLMTSQTFYNNSDDSYFQKIDAGKQFRIDFKISPWNFQRLCFFSSNVPILLWWLSLKRLWSIFSYPWHMPSARSHISETLSRLHSDGADIYRSVSTPT